MLLSCVSKQPKTIFKKDVGLYFNHNDCITVNEVSTTVAFLDPLQFHSKHVRMPQSTFYHVLYSKPYYDLED